MIMQGANTTSGLPSDVGAGFYKISGQDSSTLLLIKYVHDRKTARIGLNTLLVLAVV